MPFAAPAALAASCRRSRKRRHWLERLPDIVAELRERWSLTVAPPFEEETSAAWVAPATRADGTTAVLKIALPHMEADHEIDGLRFWDGDPTVRLLEADEGLQAMLLERFVPGIHLRSLPEPEQDAVIAQLLRRLWRAPDPPHRFRPLSEMIAAWKTEARRRQRRRGTDPGLVEEGLRLYDELVASGPSGVLLATDLHAGNVLRAEREPWLVIDPKPFVGDPAYDATQHLLNKLQPGGRALTTVRRFAELLEVDPERVRLWVFARTAAESGGGSRRHWTELALELDRGPG